MFHRAMRFALKAINQCVTGVVRPLNDINELTGEEIENGHEQPSLARRVNQFCGNRFDNGARLIRGHADV